MIQKFPFENLYYILEPWYFMIKNINQTSFIENEILNFIKTIVKEPEQYERLTILTIRYLNTDNTYYKNSYYSEIEGIIVDVYKNKTKMLDKTINKSFDNMLYNYVNNNSNDVCEYIIDQINQLLPN